MNHEVTVELHPMSAILPPDEKRWRVMIDGEQNSVHETPEQAESAASEARRAFATGWTPAQSGTSSTRQTRTDWKR